MSEFAFVVDSTADFPEGWTPPIDMYKLPLRVRINGVDYKDGVDIDTDKLCSFMNEGHDVSTSLPSFEDIVGLLRGIQNKYRKIFVLTLSQKLSGTYNAVRMAIENLELKNIVLMDSRGVSGKIFYILSRLINDVLKGRNISQQSIDTYGKDCEMFFLLGTLNHLKKGGRVGKLALLLGKLLHLKPVLRLDREGEVCKAAIGRNDRDAFEKLVRLIKAFAEKFPDYVLYGGYGSLKMKERLLELLSKFPKCDGIARVGPTVLAHTGPDVLGVLVGKAF